jgi:8-oxo-dGTP pyrophosphatase MutT (NUDIX family)
VSDKVIIGADELIDVADSWPVASTEVLARGAISSFVEEQVLTPDEVPLQRQFTVHPGAVGILALDDHERVALVRQYRHPVRHRLIEPPAGLLDVDGEDYLVGAQRELAEEVGLAARDWRVLAEEFTSPGGLSESMRMYLARDLSEAPAPDGFVKHGEEAHMDIVWASLDDLVGAVLAGRVHSPTLVVGVLAAWAAKTREGFDALRPADAPWPAREALLQRQTEFSQR